MQPFSSSIVVVKTSKGCMRDAICWCPCSADDSSNFTVEWGRAEVYLSPLVSLAATCFCSFSRTRTQVCVICMVATWLEMLSEILINIETFCAHFGQVFGHAWCLQLFIYDSTHSLQIYKSNMEFYAKIWPKITLVRWVYLWHKSDIIGFFLNFFSHGITIIYAKYYWSNCWSKFGIRFCVALIYLEGGE